MFSAMIGFQLAPGPVPENYRFFDHTENANNELLHSQNPSSSGVNDYHEFGKNFNDDEETKSKIRKKNKRSLDELESSF